MKSQNNNNNYINIVQYARYDQSKISKCYEIYRFMLKNWLIKIKWNIIQRFIKFYSTHTHVQNIHKAISLELKPRCISPIDQDGFRHAIKFSFVSPRLIDQHAL